MFSATYKLTYQTVQRRQVSDAIHHISVNLICSDQHDLCYKVFISNIDVAFYYVQQFSNGNAYFNF